MNDQPQPTQPQQPTPPVPPAPPEQQAGQVFNGAPSQSSGTYSAQPGAGAPHQVVVAKDKIVAVLLAVFLGFWTWLYTYDKDAKKFWINLGLSIVTFGLWSFVAWIWAIIDTVTKPDSYYLNFYHQQ